MVHILKLIFTVIYAHTYLRILFVVEVLLFSCIFLAKIFSGQICDYRTEGTSSVTFYEIL